MRLARSSSTLADAVSARQAAVTGPLYRVTAVQIPRLLSRRLHSDRRSGRGIPVIGPGRCQSTGAAMTRRSRLAGSGVHRRPRTISVASVIIVASSPPAVREGRPAVEACDVEADPPPLDSFDVCSAARLWVKLASRHVATEKWRPTGRRFDACLPRRSADGEGSAGSRHDGPRARADRQRCFILRRSGAPPQPHLGIGLLSVVIVSTVVREVVTGRRTARP